MFVASCPIEMLAPFALYAVRYINYSAHYDDFPGKIADRNVGFAPTFGVRLRL